MNSRVETIPPILDKSGYLDFMAEQALVIDPRSQLQGLARRTHSDAYANHFYVLSGSKGLFVSPSKVPEELIDHYQALGLDTAPREKIVTIDRGGRKNTLKKRLGVNAANLMMFDDLHGEYVVPYAMKPEVESLALKHNLSVPVNPDTVNSLSNKAIFQSYLADISPEIQDATGFDIAIDTAPTFPAGDHHTAAEIYKEMSHDGSRGIIVTKPRGHSAIYVFRIEAGEGVEEVYRIIARHFSAGEPVLIQELVDHDDSPSLQGVRMPGESYQHLYSGIQYMRTKGRNKLVYKGNGIPFNGNNVKINPAEIARMHKVHEHLGEIVLKQHNIHGVVGFDAVVGLSDLGKISTLKVTEMNLHLPSSLAVYAAAAKVFPDGFSGIARTWKVDLAKGQSPAELVASYKDLLVQEQGTYGMLPHNMSYEKRVDFIVLAPDQDALNQLTNQIEERKPVPSKR